VSPRFTDRMWAEIAPLHRRILELPFNRALADGTLEPETFVFYVVQDAHYLASFSRALAAAATRAPTAEAQVDLARFAHEAIVVERALHEGFFCDFGVTSEVFATTRPSPTCEAYGNFLIATALARPFGVGLAALLPCFQIYHEVGKELRRTASRPNPFRKWIDTYADPAFEATVRSALAHTDAAHDAAAEAERAQMRDAYILASRYEWMFWDSAWRRETWPP
jgi:thiaminase/transcriptional activator TenA